MGAVLAGGASSRFGSDKAAAMWRGRPLLEHARAALADVVREVVVVGRGEVHDLPHDGFGPLGGIAGALDHAGRSGFDSVLTVACDTPVLPRALLERLVEVAPSYCPDAPVVGHWPVQLAGELLAMLAARAPSPSTCSEVSLPMPRGVKSGTPDRVRREGKNEPSRHARNGGLSIRRWADAIGALPVSSPTPLANINTPADLLAL